MGRPRLYATPAARVAAFRARRRVQTQGKGAGTQDTTPALSHGTPAPLVPDPDAAVLASLEQELLALRTMLDTAPVHTDTLPPATPRWSPAQARAILDYQTARQELAARQPFPQGWLPRDRSTQLVPVQQRLERARARLLELHIDPETIEE